MREQVTDLRAPEKTGDKRPWWKLGPADVLLGRTEHAWRKGELSDSYCRDWIGHSWDGRSQIEFVCSVTPASALRSLVTHLRQSIREKGIAVSRLPDSSSVRRCCPHGGYGPALLVVDIDFGEFILPVGFDGDFRSRSHSTTSKDVAAGMMELIAEAHSIRRQLADQARAMRIALDEATRLASGIVPVWLRMRPWPVVQSYHDAPRQTYELVALTLDEDIQQEANGTYRVSTAQGVHRYIRSFKAQRRRAATRAKLKALGSAGLISDVALALIHLRGFKPREVMTYLKVSRLAKRSDGIVHLTQSTRETLTLVEGVVQARIDFAGGHYSSGKLTLLGDFPATVTIAAKNKLLSAFVDHPALKASGAKVTDARSRRGELNLRHRVREEPL